MIPYTRVTIAAPNRRAEIVMPSDEAVGTQYPYILKLLGVTDGDELPPLRLVRPGGTIIDLEQDLAAQQVPDGELLRLLPDDEVPPPAEISDLSGALTDATDSHPWRWKPSDRLIGTGTLLLVSGAILMRTLLFDQLHDAAAWLQVLPGLLVILIGALAVRESGRTRYARPLRGGGILLQCLGTGLLLPSLYSLATGTDTEQGTTAALSAALIAAGCVAVGVRREAWLYGALTAGGLIILRAVLKSVTQDVALTTGLTAIAVVILLGLLPWFALLVSGTSRLDDEALAGQLPARRRVDLAVLRSHDTVASASLACAAAIAWSTHHLALSGNTWARALAVTVVLATLLRSRAYPLRLEVLALWASSVPAVLALSSLVQDQTVRAAALVVAAALVAAVSLYQPSAQNRIRLRRIGNRLETLCVVATLPLLCGMQGTFSHLLRLF
ncbi:EsaB/YukD family protein [Actinomyces weissii]|uniref:EsaB/YukD family protein n=1 Tax=Actinomyces weissii TaxID=675090 RepID=A0A7T7S1R6_9ACTO|nr:EsaB/YukD family protein [Actinomyces weissii]QQM67543.1 EsaB/YukD family protein [Actinomyces weissii]